MEISKDWDELTEDEFAALDASERALVLDWRDRFGLTTCQFDHEAAVHNAEPAGEVVVECESDAAFVDRWDASIETAAE